MIGQVVKGVGGRFTVCLENNVYECHCRKVLRKDEVFVGDFVEFSEDESGTFRIDKILPRKNRLIRPYVANVDVLAIMLAPTPKPDYILVDKLILFARMHAIEFVMLINKSDLEGMEEIVNEYKQFRIFKMSAKSGAGVADFETYAENKLICLAGQSAVGKSSLINALDKSAKRETGALSDKTGRGKHTTRHAELLTLGKMKLIDTCGFSFLELETIHPCEVKDYYDEFTCLARECFYRNDCLHISEPDCAVREHAGKEFSQGFYERYIKLYEEMKHAWKNRY